MEIGQTRYDGEEPPTGVEDRMLGWHEVYGECKLPSAPKPVAGRHARCRRRAPGQMLYEHYVKEDSRFADDDPSSIERFASATVNDTEWRADRFDRGYDSVVRYGCQGCHKIRDFGDQVGYEEPPRVGPNLTFIADKVKPEWLDKWIKYPELYRVDTKMPSFFWFADKDREWNYKLGPDGKRKAIPVTDAHMIYPDLAEKLGTNTTQADIDNANLQVLAMKTYLLNPARRPGDGAHAGPARIPAMPGSIQPLLHGRAPAGERRERVDA